MPRPKLTVADLDTKECRYCKGSLREHCIEREGLWVYTPCLAVMLLDAPESFRLQCFDDKCSSCGESIQSHFIVGIQQISVRLRPTSEATPIMPAGEIVCHTVQKFMDCRA